MLDLVPVAGGVFAPSSRELAEHLLGLAAALVLRMITMARSGHDLAWDAASRLDLAGAISAIAAELGVLEVSDGACHYAAVHHLLDTAQHVCSVLHVLAGLVGGATSRTEH